MEIKTLKTAGVTVKSDLGLFRDNGYNNTLVLFSIYGSPQQTKAVFSAIASFKELTLLPDKTDIARPYGTTIRARGSALGGGGYGKHHMLIWSDEIERMAVWLGLENRAEAFRKAVDSMKVPYADEHLPMLEEVLVKKALMSKLNGWGGVYGYDLSFSDDEACDLMLEKVLSVASRIKEAI